MPNRAGLAVRSRRDAVQRRRQRGSTSPARRLAVSLAACGGVALLACGAALAGVQHARSSGAAAAGAVPLAVADAQPPSGVWLAGGLGADATAGSSSLASPFAPVLGPVAPEAVVRSRSAFEGLDAAGAVGLAERTFHVQEPAWRAPGSEAGSRVVRYLGAEGALEERPGGGRVVVQSSVPLQAVDSAGQLAPVSSALKESSEGFAAVNPVVPISISKSAAAGTAVGAVSVAPSSAAQSAAVLTGDRVFFANTGPDTDFMVEPLPAGVGVELAWQLRSEESSPENDLRFALPAGAVLRMSRRVPGGAEVFADGETLALIPPASATAANGAALAVSYSVSGDILQTRVQLGEETEYPVLVDPAVIAAGSGEAGGGAWNYWEPYTNCGCGEMSASGGLLRVTAAAGAAEGNVDWYTEGRPWAGITRVDVSNMTHQPAGETALTMGIYGGSGKPDYSFNGDGGASGEGPLVTTEGYANQPVAFCAQGAGGHDGGEQPLCAENDTGTYFLMALTTFGARNVTNWASITSAEIRYYQSRGPELHVEGAKAAWKREAEEVQVSGTDDGTGISEIGLDGRANFNQQESPPSPGSSPAPGTSVQHTAGCVYPFCPESEGATFNLGSLGTGVWTLWPWAGDPADVRGRSTTTVYVDKTAPVIATPEWSGATYGEGPHTLDVSVQDGSESEPQSGPEGIEFYVDGTRTEAIGPKCQEPQGKPAPACYGLSGSWTLHGEELGAGEHTVTIRAYDWAGNVSEASYPVTIVHPVGDTQQVGPGTLNLRTGDYKLGATDASIAAGVGSLTLTRTYDSSSSEAGSLGPSWKLGTPDGAAGGEWQSVEPAATGSVKATTTSGLKVFFTRNGNGFASPAGFQNYALTEPSISPAVYRITDSGGDYTEFAAASGSALLPVAVAQSNGGEGLNRVTYIVREGKTTEIVGPEPAGLAKSCASEPEQRGCRVLKLNYATSTTASGQAVGEWGEVKGQLADAEFVGYDPQRSEIVKQQIARYEYDKEDRLRAEWDPRISPALKTVYGYDSSGRLTAVTPPGEQPWLLHYGTLEREPNGSRLLSVSRPSASTPLGEAIAPSNTSAPALSTSTPTRGVQVSVSNGSWSHGALGYGYQWERCSSSGSECVVMGGATNQTYTPRYGDEGHTLAVLVTATNSGGSTTVATAVSSLIAVVPIPPGYMRSLGEPGKKTGQLEHPSYITSFKEYGPGDVGDGFFVTDTGNDRIVEFHEAGGTKEWFSFGSKGSGESNFLEPTGIAVEPTFPRWLFIADSGNKRVKRYWEWGANKAHEERLESTWTPPGDETGTALAGAYTSRSGEDSSVAENGASNELVEGGVGVGAGRLGGPTDLAASPVSKEFYVTDAGHDQIAIFKETESGGLGEYVGAFGEAGAGPGQLNDPRGVAVDAEGNVWVVDSGNDRVQEFTASGQYVTSFGEKSTAKKLEGEGKETEAQRRKREYEAETEAGPGQFNDPVGIAIGGEGRGPIYVVDSGDSRVEEWQIASQHPPEPSLPPASPPSNNASAVWTVEYNASVGLGTVEEWDQHDAPVEATAVLPPDEPMGWPAQDYRRASVYYFDSLGRLVNTAAPGGAISTTEYESYGNVTRTLTPGNRQRALEASTGKAAAAERLYSESTYTPDGTELVSSVGPEHEIALPGGTSVDARAVAHYSYDEGAPSNPTPYRLVSKTTEGALITSGEQAGKEADVRTITNSYSGQENLGWKLHKPTAVTTEPQPGKTETRTTLYDPTTGDVTEARAPGSPGPGSPKDSQTIYYSAASNSQYPQCGLHPEWAGLPCQAQPAKQPEDNLPKLPVTLTTYNVWDEPLTVTETVGASKRQSTTTYDAAGRTLTSAVTASVGQAVPTVSDEYDPRTGALVSQSTGSGASKQTLHSVYDTLGQLTDYTDASGNETSYSYDIDGRIESVDDGKGTQTDSYDSTTGELTKLVDTQAGTFTASYDAEGHITSEEYPGGMIAAHTYDATGDATALTYTLGKKTLYSDEVATSIHGQWLSQATTQGTDKYSYDNLGRLTETQEQPKGAHCMTSQYSYDEQSDRLNETVQEGTSKECTAKKTTSTSHSYDEADRLTDAGVEYDQLGATTAIPAGDAGGHPLESSYYASGALYSQSQNGQSNTYTLDPAGRVIETQSLTLNGSATTISHYAGAASAAAWTSEPNGNWSRRISGIGGGLAAIQTNSGTATLQLVNLHGDVVGTIADSSEAKAATLTSEPTAFGVPTTTEPSRQSWLGAGGLETELSSGVARSGTSSYIPQLGMYLGAQEVSAALTQDPLNAYLTNEQESAVTGTREIVGPDAIQPLPYSQQEMDEFWAHPPWDQPPATGTDPCSSVYNEDKKSGGFFSGGTEVAAWVDLDYCWNGSEVSHVHWRYKRARAKSSFINLKIGRWEDSARWVGSSYEAETTVWFTWNTVCPFNAPPVCGPFGDFSINFTFVVSPNGHVEEETSFKTKWF